jgi:hypothetical protein
VDLKFVRPWLGYYEGGWSIVQEGRELMLHIGLRAIPLQVSPTAPSSWPAALMSAPGSRWLGRATGHPTSSCRMSRPSAGRQANGGRITNLSMSPRAANCLTPKVARARLLLRQTLSTGRGQDVVKGGMVIRAAQDWSTVVPGAARNACITDMAQGDWSTTVCPRPGNETD